VWLKKYLYALRPVLAVRWLEQGRGVVPMEFDRLLVTIEDQPHLVREIRALVERKMEGDELNRGSAVATISGFLADELSRFTGHRPAESPSENDLGPLNVLFQRMLARAWGTA
jgi:predicted nucleotidyltransferase